MALKASFPGELAGLLDSGTRVGAAFRHRQRRVDFSFQRRDKRAAYLRRTCCSMQQGPPPAWPGRAVVEPERRSWEGPKPISIVGSTGSIGTQTLDIVAENPDKFRVVALAAGSNVTLLADQVKTFKPKLVAVRNESLLNELKEALAGCEEMPEIIPGEQGVIEVARHPDAVTVVTGIVGCAGFKSRYTWCERSERVRSSACGVNAQHVRVRRACMRDVTDLQHPRDAARSRSRKEPYAAPSARRPCRAGQHGAASSSVRQRPTGIFAIFLAPKI